MSHFQYKIVELKGIASEDEIALNAIGDAEWELVAIVRADTGLGVPKKVRLLGYLTKRPGDSQ